MKIILLVILAALLFAGCSSSDKDSGLVFSNSMESNLAWMDHPQSNIVWSDNAHSGHYVCKLDASSPYSVTYNMKVSDISKKPLKSVHISAWVNMSTVTGDRYIGISILESSQQAMDWIAQKALEVIGKPGEWHKVELNVDLLGKRNRPTNIYRIFAVNEKQDVVLLDDLTIEFEEE